MALHSGYVYLIGNHQLGRFKIGMTADVRGRLRSLQMESPVQLLLVTFAKVSRAAQVERRLHEFFGSKHVHGEWFTLLESDIRTFHDLAKRFDSTEYTKPLSMSAEEQPLYSGDPFLTQLQIRRIRKPRRRRPATPEERQAHSKRMKDWWSKR